MNLNHAASPHRRRFMRFLGASPLLAGTGLIGLAESGAARAADVAMATDINTVADVINVFDLERAAQAKLPVAHAAYLATGVEGDLSIKANRDGFSRFQIRARRLVDTTRLDTQVELFGVRWPSPIFIDPVSSLGMFDPDADAAVARAAKVGNHLHVYPTLANVTLDDVVKTRGAPPWFQLYPTRDWSITQALVKRAESAGCPVIVVTIDNTTAAGRETLLRARRLDSRNCNDCHSTQPGGYLARKRMFDGLDVTKLPGPLTDHLTWDFVKRLRDITSMKVVLKGIVTAEDATLSLQHGADGVLVSNHGGRSEESLRSTIEALPEIVAAISARVPVMIDSGFRRGSDIFKAVALGADAVGVGRPYVWGLAAFGQAGVERALEILRTELQVTMRSVGAQNLRAARSGFVRSV